MQLDEKLVIEGGRVKVVTQERQINAVDQGGVIIDYLRFTVLRDRMLGTKSMPLDTDDENLAHLMALKFAELLGYTLGDHRPGRDYYDHTFTIMNPLGQEVASVSGGGESQRDTFCFTLKGEGCTYARHGWEKRVSEFFGDLFPKITRIDLARDCWEHGQLSIEAAVKAYADHAFSYQNRLPSYTQHGCWIDGHSRTFQVGKRESGKLIRVYEKGHQFGMMDDQWVRAEVELRSVNRVIPWAALLKPGEYFAGAYEFCHWLVHQGMDNIQPARVKTATKTAVVSVEAAMRWVTRVVAPTLVQITSAMPDYDWLTHLVLNNVNRRVPRALRGLNHHAIQHGLTTFFDRINPNPGFASAV
ncbi:MAG: replication initiation factor domain-containing protein [Polaromonas sp.]|uniref:replication initiation factor domain-containing protein n=1 Tax=Polaromonas sp. TaxID=1869339 RepID=UPI0027341C34|nr:replication initiation factor domain-containing protein [Polaromonas sp.]MDP3798879.1 replication initiation factor domain-containing protein [Polaromonas sp.]